MTNLHATSTCAAFESALRESSDADRPVSLRSDAIRSSLWVMVGHGAGQALRLGSSVVLTRLLFPEAFGLMMLVNTFVQGLQMFSDVGIGPSIVQSTRGDDRKFLNTAWTIQVIRGFALWCGVWVGAWPFAHLYGQPQLAPVIVVAGLTVVIGGFSSTSLATEHRHLRLGRLTFLGLVGQLCFIFTTVCWALLSPSVWALVAGVLVSECVKCALSHFWLAANRNRLAWDHESARTLVRFGKWIFVSTAITFLAMQADRLLLGKLVPLEVLGVYSIALMLTSFPKEVTGKLTSAVLFPALSGHGRKHAEGLPPVLRRSRDLILPLAVFVVTGVVLFSRPFFQTFYDDRYADAAWIAQLLAVPVWFSILRLTSGPALLAVGDTRSLALVGIVDLPITIAGCLLGYAAAGLAGLILGYALGTLSGLLVVHVAMARAGMPVLDQDAKYTCLLLAFAVVGLFLLPVMGGLGMGTTAPGAGQILVGCMVLMLCGLWAVKATLPELLRR